MNDTAEESTTEIPEVAAGADEPRSRRRRRRRRRSSAPILPENPRGLWVLAALLIVATAMVAFPRLRMGMTLRVPGGVVPPEVVALGLAFLLGLLLIPAVEDRVLRTLGLRRGRRGGSRSRH